MKKVSIFFLLVIVSITGFSLQKKPANNPSVTMPAPASDYQYTFF